MSMCFGNIKNFLKSQGSGNASTALSFYMSRFQRRSDVKTISTMFALVTRLLLRCHSNVRCNASLAKDDFTKHTPQVYNVCVCWV